MSKTLLAVAFLVVLLSSVIPETGAVDLQPAPNDTLVDSHFAVYAFLLDCI